MRPRQACLGIRGPVRPMACLGHQASMRPRQACLGIRLGYPQFEWPLRRFNEAEASLPRNTCLRNDLTIRRQNCFNEAEASLPRNTLSRSQYMEHLGLASMRPRQACLGIRGARPPNASEWPDASMRPRQACLGIQAPLRCQVDQTVTLQ